jgi:hypothetical protein
MVEFPMEVLSKIFDVLSDELGFVVVSFWKVVGGLWVAYIWIGVSRYGDEIR